ncbi:unnamed protein product (macronuclear) [Paramecium tetraurelia]|uniref:Uncharacterized protein n=1 Tax=Paramecium tetraurelia TaxID=5888 RepID=A0C112_PARTE|nr:uncharacterized protein GSPATT00033955001 [Paramecium tetraurelia]CAK64479.1 unnamed protein product [Paramecium tetraurelia]|eukprot:XP_001431877.1 hypothetical protein (macronuclear) [Paramecium tetraurelia strain d4-2]
MDYEDNSINLYNYIVNRKPEHPQSINVTARPLNKRTRTFSFELQKPSPFDVQKKQLRFGSRQGTRLCIKKEQQIRRRSCNCTNCGHDNTKIVHLMYKGAISHQQLEYANQQNKKKQFIDDAVLFSKRLSRRLNLFKIKFSSTNTNFRKRCNSCDTHIPYEQLMQAKQIHQQLLQRKDTHTKTQLRHNFLVKRQQTINDKLLLIPIKTLKTVQDTQVQIKSIPTQPTNTPSKAPKKKLNNKIFIPVTRSILPQLTPTSKFTLSTNKSIDFQLKYQLTQSIKQLQRSTLVSKKNSLSNITNPYRNISSLDYLLKVRRRQVNNY